MTSVPPYPQVGYPPQPGFPPPPLVGVGYPAQPGYNPNCPPPTAQPGYQPPPPGFAAPYSSGYSAPGGELNSGFGPAQDPPPYTQYPAYPQQDPSVAAASASGDDKYVAGGDVFGGSFSDKAIRRAFIRKVYSILMLQLTATCGLIALFVFEENTKKFLRRNVWLYYVSYAIFFVTYLVLACVESVRRKHPTNIIMLTIFTASMGFMVAMISSFHKTNIVFYSMAICAVVCLGVTIFAMQTKFDFTLCGSFLFICVLVLFVFGIIAIVVRDRIFNLILAAAMALLFTLYLAYDTQMIMGGKRYEMSPDEYIFGAMQLYLDVVYIFLSILSIFGNSN